MIAWQTLNKQARKEDTRFTDAFLVVTPGITIRDRLRVLLPNDANDYYRALEVVPAHQLEQLGRAKIIITNYHAFQLRDTQSSTTTTKQILRIYEVNPFKESPEKMVRRVCGDFGKTSSIIVFNDEAHHCYRRKPVDLEFDGVPLTGDDRKEAEQRHEEARVWISGLEDVQQTFSKKKLAVKTVYDLSATPFYLSGSGYGEGS